MSEAVRSSIQSLLLSVFLLSSCTLQAFAYYHPDEGRGINRDPIGEQGGVNSYVWCGNDGVEWVDSLGLRKCKVDEFSLKVGKWLFVNYSIKFTCRLPVSFKVELSDCVREEDCLIDQDIRGEFWYTNPTTKTRVYEWNHSSWAKDYWQGDTESPPAGFSDWWNGQDWQHSGLNGKWTEEWWGTRRVGTFEDLPGVRLTGAAGGKFGGNIGGNFPLRYGGSGGKGHQEFRTNIKDKETGETVKSLNWGTLIEYKDYKTGKHYFYL